MRDRSEHCGRRCEAMHCVLTRRPDSTRLLLGAARDPCARGSLTASPTPWGSSASVAAMLISRTLLCSLAATSLVAACSRKDPIASPPAQTQAVAQPAAAEPPPAAAEPPA